MKKKRIIWLLNHTTLMEFEVGLLIDLGFEVYVPKKTPLGCSGRTSSISYNYDKTLSISNNDINKLNDFNFYMDEMSDEVINIINKNFAGAIVPTIYPGLYNFAKYFKGKIFVRVFGHSGDMNYELATTDAINKVKKTKNLCSKIKLRFYKFFKPKELTYNNIIMRTFYLIKNRIYFAQGYKNLKDNEHPFWANRAIYLPLGIPKSIMEHKNSWRGGSNQIMFVCPNINQIPYYENFYNLFVKHFGNFPYLIAGKQTLPEVESEIKYNDKNIMGYSTREQYDEWLKTCSCMFYHSQEPRHLHYHPLEAIVFGMPVIYMSGGLLESFGGENQPGMAKSYEEAREKIQKILDGDTNFINEIKEKQTKILDEFDYDYVKKTWEENFLPLVKK